MRKEIRVKEFQLMFDKINDPELRAKAKRETDKKKRMEDKKSDVGL